MASTQRYRVFLEDGGDLDDYVTTGGPWQPGDTIYAGGLPAYRITKVIPARRSRPLRRNLDRRT